MEWSKFYQQAYLWILHTGPKLIIGLVVLLLGLWLIRFFKRWLNHHLLKRDIHASVRPFLLNVVVVILQVLLALTCMQIIGIQMTVFTAVVGAFGVAAGLALSGTLQNFTSGILILLLKPFRVGDNVIAQGQEGTVSAIEIFFTIVTTYDNRTVIIPNSKLSNEIILNLSFEKKRRMDIELKFSFAVELEKVRAVLEKSLASVGGVLKDPEHRIGVSSLDPDGYKVMLNVWAAPHGFIDAKMALQEKIMQDMKAAGIKLPGL